jgi:phosphoglycerate dehydrogenase-like enzyme
MTMLYTDVVDAPDAETQFGLRRVPLDELLASSDAVTIHTPLLPSTRGLIGAEQLRIMKHGAILVNTARGAIVDAGALAEACRAGRILAGIDVFDPEPPPADHPLLGCPNVVLSPHTAGVTRESVQRIMAAALDNLRRFAGGQPLRDVVNGVEVHT